MTKFAVLIKKTKPVKFYIITLVIRKKVLFIGFELPKVFLRFLIFGTQLIYVKGYGK